MMTPYAIESKWPKQPGPFRWDHVASSDQQEKGNERPPVGTGRLSGRPSLCRPDGTAADLPTGGYSSDLRAAFNETQKEPFPPFFQAIHQHVDLVGTIDGVRGNLLVGHVSRCRQKPSSRPATLVGQKWNESIDAIADGAMGDAASRRPKSEVIGRRTRPEDKRRRKENGEPVALAEGATIRRGIGAREPAA
jgi:hypothetical protein